MLGVMGMTYAQERIQASIFQRPAFDDEYLPSTKDANLSLPFHYYFKQIRNMNNGRKLVRDNAASTQEEAQEAVQLRFLHVSPNAPSVDIYLNHKLAVPEFSFKQVSSQLILPRGICQIHIFPAGTQAESVLYDEIFIVAGNSYTIAVIGEYQELQLFCFFNSSIVPPGEAKFRFIHLAQETSAVDLAVKNRDIVFPQISFKQVTEYLGVTPMTIDLELRTAGKHEIVLPIPKQQFKANIANSIVLIGFTRKHPTIEVILLQD